MNSVLILRDKGMPATQKYFEQGSNAFGTLAPFPWNIAHVIGWETGRTISNNDWYRENVRPLIQDALGIQRDEFPKPSRFADIPFEVPKK